MRHKADGTLDTSFGVGGNVQLVESSEVGTGLAGPFLVQGSAVLVAGRDAAGGPLVYRRLR